ncbi:conserved hypothetical plastid protein (plastid) [Chondrus crispus]|uniref:Conserved hypothetical plastid protein n=1 Tax=Chondrus crispus TaxID=2769 RepID=M5DDF1_CHOCR|nr:conserved hypothetical plastid protein [Chondrus crispus]CCP38094.1 conserved hypothetical plastid protein [Chondrus crispus]|eukprot:YP_007627347.1 conserved hypothetical plastid protein (plastid) [Chondrus crispus]
MYFIKSDKHSSSNHNLYICIVNKFYIYIQASIVLQNIFTSNYYVISFFSYYCKSIIKYKLGLLMCLLYFVLNFNSLYLLILDVNFVNIYTFSLYYWIGFQIIAKRFNYYPNQLYKSNNNISTAYSLINSKLLSKNILRRYLIFTILLS